MISVCIATYNGAKYIEEELDSILLQLKEGDELVISDDCSTDETVNIINSFHDERIKLFINKANIGYTRNFERTLRLAKGDIIFIADQDDIWLQNKIEIYLQYFIDYDFIVSDAIVIDGRGNLLSDSFFSQRKSKKTIVGNLFKFGYLGCCMAFKKKILDKALPFPNNNILCTYDNWLFLIGFIFYRGKILNKKLIKYRRHGMNFSSGGLKNSTSILFKVHYRLYLLFNLILRIL